MVELGTNSGNSFTETVTGYETPTLTESGNPATATFNRTITGGGTYNRTDTGPGATLSNVTGGTDNYTLTESGDSLGAVFSQTLTGTDRYGLLQNFSDVSNTGSNTPGNMNFLPFGQAFEDPAVIWVVVGRVLYRVTRWVVRQGLLRTVTHEAWEEIGPLQPGENPSRLWRGGRWITPQVRYDPLLGQYPPWYQGDQMNPGVQLLPPIPITPEPIGPPILQPPVPDR